MRRTTDTSPAERATLMLSTYGLERACQLADARRRRARTSTYWLEVVAELDATRQRAEARLERDALIATIAAEELNVRHLEPRHSDSLDFLEVGVVSLACALRRAYDAGRVSK